MEITFQLEYHTQWGEEVAIVGNIPQLGNYNQEEAIILSTIDGRVWQKEIELNINCREQIEYYFIIKKEGIIERIEWHTFPHTFFVDETYHGSHLLVCAAWKEEPVEKMFYSSAFTDAVFSRKGKTADPLSEPSFILEVSMPYLSPEYTLGISGNQAILGNWKADKAVKMNDSQHPKWKIELPLSSISFPMEYKFVIINNKESKIIDWEKGENRTLYCPNNSYWNHFLIECREPQFEWAPWKGAGVAVPVFSLRSKMSEGIGDFEDLREMIQWANQTGMKAVQILPVNDTTRTHTWRDSYPYNSISIYALHPLYLRLDVSKLSQKGWIDEYESTKKELNQLSSVDYEKVEQFKWKYMRLLYQQEGDKVLQSDAFSLFFEENKHWLIPYAAFSYLRDKYHTSNFNDWQTHHVYRKEEIDFLCAPTSPEYKLIAFYYYIQFLLHQQLSSVTQFARENHIILKGDIPIGISRNSVEAWMEPQYFHLNGQAGAPPDDFSVNGQNWGFPTYNWEEMAKNNYDWWYKRFRKMANYFDAYRIDHILGFFRIWEIPIDAVHGLLGQFTPALPLSKEEIESYGMKFKEAFLQPYIHEKHLSHIFGAYTEYVKTHFLMKSPLENIYQLRPQYDTQRKVEQYFIGQEDARSLQIKEGLYKLISNVLFVKDRDKEEHYHPRIAVQNETVFSDLSAQEQEAFGRLYNEYFYQRHNEFWKKEALKKLPRLINATNMLVCGEDLGMIPSCVPEVMHQLQILSLEIERMPKAAFVLFGNTDEYPYRSISTFSTHDMSTMRGWWEESPKNTGIYYHEILHHKGEAPSTASTQICEEIVGKELNGNSILCILSLQDWLSMDNKLRPENPKNERINDPSNPHHYWRYRMGCTLEELMQSHSINDKIKSLLEYTHRR